MLVCFSACLPSEASVLCGQCRRRFWCPAMFRQEVSTIGPAFLQGGQSPGSNPAHCTGFNHYPHIMVPYPSYDIASSRGPRDDIGKGPSLHAKNRNYR